VTEVNAGDVLRARAGDRDAFDTLAMRAVDRLYRVARLILRDTERAEDAVQEALVRCWRDLPSLRDAASFDAWLNRLLMRAINDEFRATTRARSAVALLRLETSTRDSSEEVAVREQLDRGFRRLSVEHRAVIVLRLYLGLSLEETATTLGIPAGTAKSRLHYATAAMRDALEADARLPIKEVSA
jgi:RNA polymerase sigma-70 factor (ECF subfamily)